MTLYVYTGTDPLSTLLHEDFKDLAEPVVINPALEIISRYHITAIDTLFIQGNYGRWLIQVVNQFHAAGASVILNVQPQELFSNEYVLDVVEAARKSGRVTILTPLPGWLSGTELTQASTIEMRTKIADTKTRQVDDRTRVINYLGTIPKMFAAIRPKANKVSKLAAICFVDNYSENAASFYDWCMVADAAKSGTAVDIFLIHSGLSIDVNILPQEFIFNNPMINIIKVNCNSMDTAISLVDSCKGVIGIPDARLRYYGCATAEWLLPAYCGKVSQHLAEPFFVNIRNSIFGTSDVTQYRSNWSDIMLGIIDPKEILGKQLSTLSTKNYYGLYMDDGSPTSLLNILKNPDQIN